MKIFDILNKDYDELTESEKKTLSVMTGTLIFGGGLALGVCVGNNYGRKQAFNKARSMSVKVGKEMYIQGAADGIAGTMYIAHEYSPESFKELMKIAQDKGFKGLYGLGLQSMEFPKGYFELH